MTHPNSRFGRILKTEISRKSFLTCLGGFAVGVPLGYVASDQLRAPDPEGGRQSFAQGGEDIAADFFFQYVGLSSGVAYLDIGAYDPVKINNTYFFYRKGNKGVLVEPNVTMCEKLREVRPRDTTLAAGIGVNSVKEADYYLMSDPSWNTFSKEEAEHQEVVTGKKISIKKVIKMPLLNINDVMQEHFGKAPTFVSIDAEGLHFAILKSIDFDRFRPPLICVETLISGTTDTISEIPEFMTTQGYVARGGSFVNTLFVDSKILKPAKTG
jgi:Methyltransferase FkbM domain